MTGRERVLAALNHQEPDRVPYDQGTTFVTGIHRIAYDNLLEALGMSEQEPRPILDPIQQLATPHKEVLEHLGVDTRSTYLYLPGRPDRPEPKASEDEDYRQYTGEWGITWRMPTDGGLYYDMCAHPLEGATVADVEAHDWPDPLADLDRDKLIEVCREVREAGEYALIVGGYGAGFLELDLWLQGFNDGYANLVANKPVTEAVLDNILRIKLEHAQAVLEAVGQYTDIFYLGDDLGHQDRPAIRVEWFRELLRPRYLQYFGLVRKLAPQAKIFFHSCGSVYDLLPEVIETGIDILNPVQVSAAEMGDTARLKREFGDVLTFWGGIDTQQVLPRGTPQEVKDEVRRRIDDLAPGGGYVLNTVHNIQADVPPENILAMVEALDEHGWR